MTLVILNNTEIILFLALEEVANLSYTMIPAEARVQTTHSHFTFLKVTLATQTPVILSSTGTKPQNEGVANTSAVSERNKAVFSQTFSPMP